MSTNIEIYNAPTSGWEELPQDLLSRIFSEISSNDKCNISCVCKVWHNFFTNNNFGLPYLKKLGIKEKFHNSWITHLRDFIDTPRIIALDVSGSMNFERMRNACKIIEQLATAFFDAIELRGLECIVFADIVYSKTIFNKEEVLDFFLADYEDIESEVDLGLGTSTNRLFECLVHLQQIYESKTPKLACEVTIISDFEDSEMNFNLLKPKQSNMHIQCINMGGNLGSTYLNLLNEKYEETIEELNEELQLEARTILEARAKKEEKSQVKGEQRGRKRKREREIITFSIDVPLRFSVVDQESWEPLQKKQKISFTYPYYKK